MSSKQIRFYLTLIISVCFAYWVYGFFSGSEALGYIVEHYANLYLLVFAHLPSLIFDSLAWMVLMTKKKLTFYWCVIITWISQTAGKFLPTGNITGEFVRIYLSVQKGMNSVNSSSIVLADLAIATFSLLLIAIFSLSIVLGFNDDLTTFEDNYKYHKSDRVKIHKNPNDYSIESVETSTRAFLLDVPEFCPVSLRQLEKLKCPIF